MKENICTLIWVSQHLDIKEFGLIRQQFALKFGINLDNEAICNIDNCVNAKIIEYLSPNPPEEVLVFSYLKTIANENQIEWKAQELEDIPNNEPTIDSEFAEFTNSESDIANALFFDRKAEEKTKHEKTVDVNTDNIDEFDSMFASIPDNGHVIQPAAVVRSTAPLVQKVVKLEPSIIQSNLSAPVTVQPILHSSITPITPISKVPASPIALSERELEEEFEKMFNSSSTEASIPEVRSAPASILSPTPVVAPAQTSQIVSTGTSSEYADLFSAVPITSNRPMGGVKLPGLIPTTSSLSASLTPVATPAVITPQPTSKNDSDFSDIFARLASMNASQPSSSPSFPAPAVQLQ